MIDYLPHDYLKMAFRELVMDGIMGHIAADALLTSARARAKRECDDIIEAVTKAYQEFRNDAPAIPPIVRVNREADDPPACGSSNNQAGSLGPDDLVSRLTPLLGQAIKLCYLGQLVDGPILAWKCLLAVVKFDIRCWEDGTYELFGYPSGGCLSSQTAVALNHLSTHLHRYPH